MGIYGALQTAVTGMAAQSFALENISGNIANSQTTGYKRMETGFIDLIPDAAVGRQVPGAVLAYSRSTNDVRGDIITSATGTHVALNGGGFFVVAEKTGSSDGESVFGEANFYTRRGDFEMDREGYLYNGAGYYLKGVPIDSSTGNVAGSVPEMVRVSNGLIAAKATQRIDYELNLPAVPAVGLLTADPGDADFLDQTVEGGAITVYAPNGASANVQLRWGKTADADATATPPTADTWQLFYYGDSGWEAVSDGTATFSNGVIDTIGWGAVGADGAFPPLALDDLTVDGTLVGDVEIDFGTGGLTQFDNANGRASVTTLAQDGYPAGSFMSVAINDSGRVVATYSNGEQIEIYQLVTANFNAENQLKRLDGGVYSATAESGEAILSTDGGMTGGALESSNTDISEEFTKLIVTQQAYAAGTRIVSTSDEMLQEALNMMR
ncbi:flagellar hook-basal body complex protein [Pelagibacterium sp. H642]|uniref:flagellar hook protein FlgE n=1 Tax=Pelagibacterium sp. H642 TaxID=1881069 RepID=UPI00281503BD|nr:flagellar hook-basal body complex protein [Pelagibacterium sp. H642]WMT89980.1 flagellar hook-basal body complex protein [Pelagibacterium sp. H642]